MSTTTIALYYKPVVEKMLEDLKKEVASNLKPVGEFSDRQLAVKLYLYALVIAPNFMPWMTYIWIRSGGEALFKNLECELQEKHPEMLWRFLHQIKWPQDKEAEEHALRLMQQLQPVIGSIASLVQYPSLRTDGLLVLAGLENASLVFIPWLREAGQRLGFTDFEYVDKHGVADIEHATELSDEVASVALACGKNPNDLLQSKALGEVNELLRLIFNLE